MEQDNMSTDSHGSDDFESVAIFGKADELIMSLWYLDVFGIAGLVIDGDDISFEGIKNADGDFFVFLGLPVNYRREIEGTIREWTHNCEVKTLHSGDDLMRGNEFFMDLGERASLLAGTAHEVSAGLLGHGQVILEALAEAMSAEGFDAVLGLHFHCDDLGNVIPSMTGWQRRGRTTTAETGVHPAEQAAMLRAVETAMPAIRPFLIPDPFVLDYALELAVDSHAFFLPETDDEADDIFHVVEDEGYGD